MAKINGMRKYNKKWKLLNIIKNYKEKKLVDNPEKIKKFIYDCYCKNVSKKYNNDLYEELSNLLGLYSYTKDKLNKM